MDYLTPEELLLASQKEERILKKIINLVKDDIFNLSFYYLNDFQTAEDCTQEILLKIINRIDSLQDPALLKNWSSKVAANYLRNYKRDNEKFRFISFEIMEQDSQSHLEAPFDEVFDIEDKNKYIYELKVSCTMAMLMCLKEEDRMVFVLSSLLNLNSNEGAELLNINPQSYRKKLSRGKEKLMNFVNKNCGLLNKENSCVCKKRLKYAIAMERIKVGSFYFISENYLNDKTNIDEKIEEMERLEEFGEIFRNNPKYKLPDDVVNKVLTVIV